MSHVRQQIRDKIVTTLTGLTTTASRVYKSRVYPMDTAKLPGICVYTKSETQNYETMGSNRTISHQLEVAIEVYVRGLTGYDDLLDTVATEIELALSADRTLGALAKDTKITSFRADYSGEGEKPVATGEMTVEITYHTKEATPEVAV